MAQATSQGFYAAPFAFNGELAGVGAWQISALSPRWLAFSREVLRAGGAAFYGPLRPPFGRVGLRFTSARGAALGTFSLDGVPVASSPYLRGDDLVAERQLLELFVESLRRVDAVRQSQTTPQPFAEVFGISERPLHVVVAWGASPGDDSELIAQLGTHFAGAFFMGEMPSNETLDRLTRSAASRVFQCEGPWHAPRPRSALRCEQEFRHEQNGKS